jgi:hypothetical protein
MSTSETPGALGGRAGDDRCIAERWEPSVDGARGAAAQDFVGNPLRQRQIEALCRTPRLVAELLDEMARNHGIADDLVERLARYAAADGALLAALGGDRFPAPCIFAVGGHQ